MAETAPVLDLAAARPVAEPGAPTPPPVTLRLMPGELALVEAPDPDRATWLADLCSGLVPLADGTARFLGREWPAMPDHYAAALRGRIGRVFAVGNWIGFVDVATNILLPQLHHTRRDPAGLRADATRLACAFGLPGLPLGRPSELSPGDLARAACVRAFLGEPTLLLLESPTQGRFLDLVSPLLNAIATARSGGAAAIWLTRSSVVWHDHSFPADHRLRLGEQGLLPARRAA
jgi:phospholipid/cholesterol/gamma-HCH transport system ATP-binding protein